MPLIYIFFYRRLFGSSGFCVGVFIGFLEQSPESGSTLESKDLDINELLREGTTQSAFRQFAWDFAGPPALPGCRGALADTAPSGTRRGPVEAVGEESGPQGNINSPSLTFRSIYAIRGEYPMILPTRFPEDPKIERFTYQKFHYCEETT